MATVTLLPNAAVDRICHDEQMVIWTGDLAGALSVAGFLRDDISYDDGVDLNRLLGDEIRSIVRMALDHPESRTIDSPPPSSAPPDATSIAAEARRAALLEAAATFQKLPKRFHGWKIDDVLCALADQAADDGWRPIETAPHEATLLGIVDGEVRLIRWAKASHVPLYGWCLADQGAEDRDLCKPSRWRPVPAPSALASKEDGNG